MKYNTAAQGCKCYYKTKKSESNSQPFVRYVEICYRCKCYYKTKKSESNSQPVDVDSGKEASCKCYYKTKKSESNSQLASLRLLFTEVVNAITKLKNLKAIHNG